MAFKAVIEEGGRYQETWILKIRSKGTKPFIEPLPYKMKETHVQAVSRYNTNVTYGPAGTRNAAITEVEHARCDTFSFLSSNDKNAVHNKALNKVADQLEYVSNLFEAWYERKEAYTLLGSCLKGINTFVRRWKDPRYWKQMRKTHGQNIKDPSSLPQAWLLWNFAVKPLVGTIDDVIKLLCQDMPVWWVEGSSGRSASISIKDSNRKFNGEYSYVCKHAVRVVSLNPNAQLLNIMGATTPFSTYLSVVPWFWAVNYFVNVNALVSNFEIKFPGVNVDKSYTTVFAKAEYGGVFETPTLSHYDRTTGEWVRNPLDLFRPDVRHVSVTRTVSTKIPTYKLNISYPALGTNQFANLTSAIALTMKGKK